MGGSFVSSVTQIDLGVEITLSRLILINGKIKCESLLFKVLLKIAYIAPVINTNILLPRKCLWASSLAQNIIKTVHPSLEFA